MAKTLEFTFEGKDYTLEFTRKTVAEMERNGFVIREYVDKPVSTLPTLFAGAFLAHHRRVKQEVIDNIFSRIINKTELLNKLAEMYNEPLDTLLAEPEEGEGNVEWTPSW